MSQDGAPAFDPSNFRNDPYVTRLDKPWGWELHWTRAGLPYMGKMLHLKAGAQLSLQLHDEKQESWMIMQGRGKVIWENSERELVETELEPGQGYTCALGQKHRLAGITDCDIIEVSTPELGTTWRLDDDYTRPHETPAQRAKERSS